MDFRLLCIFAILRTLTAGQIILVYSVSKLEMIDGRYIQYFENVRMEWWPERAAGERVVLTDVVEFIFDKVVANPELLKANVAENVQGKLVNPVVRVFAQKALIGAGEQQTLYIIVQNQNLQPMQAHRWV